MYFPEGLKQRLRGPGSSFPIGAGATSLAFAAIASGWLGVAILFAIFLVLFGVELYREAASLDSERRDLKSEVARAQADVTRTKEIEERNLDLERANTELREKNREPSVGLEGLLGSIDSQLEYVQLAKAHRLLSEQMGDAPVTKLEVQGPGDVVVASAASNQGALLENQLVALVEGARMREIAIGAVTQTTPQGLKAKFEISLLPIELAEEVENRGAVTPTGYSIQLAGLFLNHYGELTNDQLSGLEQSLAASHEAILGALSASQSEKGLLEQGPGQVDTAMHADHATGGRLLSHTPVNDQNTEKGNG